MSIDEILPIGWQLEPLIELLDSLESGSRPKGGVKGIASGVPSIGGEHLDSNGGFKFENVRYVPENFADSMTRGQIEKGDVLVVKDGATTGKTSFVGALFPFKRAVVNEHVFLCRCSNQINCKYVFYYLYSEIGNRQILEDFRGAAQGGISQRFAELVKVPVAPISEQIRIVEKLEELLSDLDAGVAELKAAQKKLVQYRQSLLKATVEGVLTADWRKANQPKETGAQLLERILKERRSRWEAKQLAKYQEQEKTPPQGWQEKYPEPVKPDTSDFSELPEGWVWASLDQLTEFITSGSRGWAAYYSSEGATFIRSQNINKDWLDLSDIAFVNPPRNSEGDRTRVEMDDLLLTITGANVGKAARVEMQIEEAYVSQHVALIRIVDAVLSNYLHLFLTASAGGRGQLDKVAYGAGKPGLNLQQVRSIVVPLPSHEESGILMDNLTNQFNAVVDQEKSINHALKQSTVQRKNILKAAFSGQLAPQDPSDEPACVLLERIRAGRAAIHKAVKTRIRRN